MTDDVKDVWRFLFILTFISYVSFPTVSAKTHDECGGNLNGCLMVGCVRNNRAKNY